MYQVLLGDLVACQRTLDHTSLKDQDTVADRRELVEIGTGAEYGSSGGSGLSDDPENQVSRAHVHSLGRFLEQNYLRPELEPLAEERLLLVSA